MAVRSSLRSCRLPCAACREESLLLSIEAMRPGRLYFLDEVGVELDVVAQCVEKRCLQSAEAVIEACDVRLCKFESLGVALGCKAVDMRSAGIGGPMTLAHLSNASPAASSIVCPSTSMSDGLLPVLLREFPKSAGIYGNSGTTSSGSVRMKCHSRPCR